MSGNIKTIKVDYLPRVEGEGALDVVLSDTGVSSLQLKIFEPPRFFQSILVGRKYDEVPDIVARICGICPASHILASIQALEQALGIEPSEETVRMRQLLALSQWIQSHALHTYMLALPDYMGYESVLDMLPQYQEVVEQALRLKRLGNDLTTAVGGREVHPVTAVVGGFTRAPSPGIVRELLQRFKKARRDALDMVEITAGLSLPEFSRDCEYVSLQSPGEYPVIAGSIVSNKGLDLQKEDYRNWFSERHLPHSTALHSSILGRSSFMVGPLSRVNLNFDNLVPEARQAARDNSLAFPAANPFTGVWARALEVVHSIETCIRLLEELALKADLQPVHTRAGVGTGVKEAPRGLLYHHYELDRHGYVVDADIVSPTAHNVHNIEEDLKRFLPEMLHLPAEEVRLKCEMLVRAYDPCISCSAHFLKVNIRSEGQ